MALAVLRPNVMDFIELATRSEHLDLQLEETTVAAGSRLVGQAMKDSPIRRETKLLVIAVRDKARTFVYNPDPDFIIDGGTTLIVMGDTESVVKLRKILDDSMPPEVADTVTMPLD